LGLYRLGRKRISLPNATAFARFGPLAVENPIPHTFYREHAESAKKTHERTYL
jgi:hypothetical protein